MTSRGRVVCAVALVGVALTTADAHAAGPPTFASAAPIALTPGQSTAAAVCGGGASNKATVVIDGLPKGAISVNGSTAPEVTVDLAESGCARLQLSASVRAATGKGSVAVATEVGVTRRTISVAPGPSGTESLKAPLSALTLKANRNFTKTGADLADGEVPFGPYPAGTEVAPTAVHAPSNTVAVLQSGSDTAYLVKTGGPKPADAEHGIAAFLVRLADASHTGTYKGTITYDKADGTPAKLPVTVLVGDSIWWCIAAVFAGVLLSLLASLTTLRWRPKLAMRVVPDKLAQEYGNAVESFNVLARRNSGIPSLRPGSVETFAHKLEGAVRAYFRTHYLVDYDSDDYKSVQNLLNQKDEELEYLGDKQGLIVDLIALRDAVAAFEFPLNLRRPRLLCAARQKLLTRAIAVGTATQLGADARAIADALGTWPSLYYRLLDDEDFADELAADIPSDPPTWGEHLQEQLASAQGRLTRARGALFDASSAEALTAADVSGLLDAAEIVLTDLAPLVERRVTQPITVYRGIEAMLGVSAVNMLDAATNVTFRSRAIAVYKQIAMAPRIEATAVKLADKTLGRLGYLLIYVLAFAGALAVTLPTVFSPTFGSVANYLAALGLGSAAGVASKAILDGVANMRRAPQ